MKPQASAVGLNTVVMALTNATTRNALVSLEPRVSERQPFIQDAFRNGIENFSVAELESTVSLFTAQPPHLVAVCVDPQQFSILESIANQFFSGYVVHAAGWFLAQSLGTIETTDDKLVVITSDVAPVVSEKVSWYDPMVNLSTDIPTAKKLVPIANVKANTIEPAVIEKSKAKAKTLKVAGSEKRSRAKKTKPVAVSTYVVPSREEIKHLRERLSLTQSAAAKQMGISRSCITEMERGREKRATDPIRWRIFTGLQKIALDQGLII